MLCSRYVFFYFFRQFPISFPPNIGAKALIFLLVGELQFWPAVLENHTMLNSVSLSAKASFGDESLTLSRNST